MKTNQQNTANPISKAFEKIKAIYFSCINCRKELDPKRIRRIESRCKKCEREYHKIWPTVDEHYKFYEGQH